MYSFIPLLDSTFCTTCKKAGKLEFRFSLLISDEERGSTKIKKLVTHLPLIVSGRQAELFMGFAPTLGPETESRMQKRLGQFIDLDDRYSGVGPCSVVRDWGVWVFYPQSARAKDPLFKLISL